MSKAYRINPDGNTTLLKRVRVRNEEQDLQLLLENNPDLLVGEQIRPEDPCRWLLIDREISVPDPESGSDRWSLDLFLVDQDATPTFVECKRFQDTRSRREVVAQMLDYAANANYYWKKEDLKAAAERTAERHETDLETRLTDVATEWEDGVDAFFQRVEEKLREGVVRMVFFLEEAPWQLRSIVDFLNRQMERSEVLLVEARHYEDGNSRIVVPHLFGYTEEARRVKRNISVTGPRRKGWNRDMFMAAISDQFDEADVERFNQFLNKLESMGATMSWGTGAIRGSISPKWPSIASRSLISVFTDGQLVLNFKWLAQEEDAALQERFFSEIQSRTSLELPPDAMAKYPTFEWEAWRDSMNDILETLRAVVHKENQA